MPRKAAGLTAAKVRTAAPGRYGDGAGLYLLVKPPSAKQVVAGARDGGRFWIVRYQHAGRGREMGLGPAVGPAPVSLAEARDKVRELHRQLRDGIDPLDQREADQAAARAAVARAKSFRAVATLYLDSHDVALRNAKHRMQWRNTLANYAYPHMGDTPIADVATGHIMAALEPIWRMKSETASRVRQRVEAVLDYATARGWRSGENPARWRGHISVLLPSPAKVKPVEHHAALPWQDIGAFMAKLRVEGSLAARAMELAILTASRTGEVLGARWPEVDLEAALWTVPASRMKAKREHRVPLCPAAVSLLRGLLPLRDAGNGDFLFPGQRDGKHLSDMVLLMLLRRMERGDLTAHGFRSTFRDWCAEATSYAREVAEAALAHSVGDKVEAAYRRGDLFEKRRGLMDEWAAFCAAPAASASAAG